MAGENTFAESHIVDPLKRGRGRFWVSEGVAPAEKIEADTALMNLLDAYDGGKHYKVVMLTGTIVSCYVAPEDHLQAGKLVAAPCIGGVPSDDDAKLAALAIPLGVLTQDAWRPFQHGETEGISFITRGYVEWPMVKTLDADGTAVFDNTDIEVGDYVKPDTAGRPVKWIMGTDADHLRIGRVVAVQTIGVDYDYAFLNYMQLPAAAFENELVRNTLTGNVVDDTDIKREFGLAANVDGVLNGYDVANDAVAKGATGVMRVNVNIV